MRIGIFGGTFNPPHRGHLQSALEAARQLNLDKLFIIPTYKPPHKALPEGSPSAETRFEMAKILFEGQNFIEVSDIELRRRGTSYTVDTISRVAADYPGSRLFLLLGTDMFLNIESWKDSEKILRRTVLAVFAREKGKNAQIEAHARFLKKRGGRVQIIKNDAAPISSTDLRELLRNRGGLPLLGDALYSYIIRRRIYGAKSDFNWLREKTYAMLEPKRIPHVAGCEEEAVRLARHWGASEEAAREAAILHDITKKNELDEQLKLCEKYGIIADTVEKDSKKLLHAKTGAEAALNNFGVSDGVYNAILWHTTGRSNMSLLEQVLYIADYIEPTRDFEGVDILRRLAYEDLSAAVKLGLEMCIQDLSENGIAPHPRTKEAIDCLRG